MRIIFGIDVPYRGYRYSHWEPGEGMVYIPAIRKKDLFFELCDICGTQIPPGRQKRGITTCSPACNTIKWERIKEEERKLTGKRAHLFWGTIKYECFLRDGNTCQKCGSKDKLECHHIVPVVLGGSNELSNLITLCHSCHSEAHPKALRKSAKRMRENHPLIVS